MSFRSKFLENKPLYYWILPMITVGLLVLMNHSGIKFLQTVVSPDINREFGLLEHLQVVVILMIIGVCIHGVASQRHWLERTIYFFAICFFFVAFLEELDYGLHYYEYYYNIPGEKKVVERNLHNYDDNRYLFWVRQAIILVMVVTFIILPLLKPKISSPFIKHFCGTKWLLATFAVYVIIGQMARLLPKLGLPTNPSLVGNHQEFEELVSYYMIWLYMFEITVVKDPLFAKNRGVKSTI